MYFMKKQTLKQLEKQKEEIEKKIEKLKLENSKDDYEWIKIPKTNFEVTKEVLHKGKSYNEIIELKPKDCELLSLELIGKILKNPDLVKQLKTDSKYSTSDDFFFEQPFETNKNKNYVAQFYSGSGWSDFDCNGDADYGGRSLGVRWCRKRKKNGKA